MIESETPTLWELRSQLGHPAAIAILVNAFIHTAKLVNLDKNITNEQIGEAANDILQSYGYLKVEEIKFLLKRALRTQNVYGRLDYNVLMNWVEQYDAERTEEAMRISDSIDARDDAPAPPPPDALSFDDYVRSLRARAPSDPQAAKLLSEIDNPPPTKLTFISREERERRDHEFRMWRTFNYLSRNKQ